MLKVLVDLIQMKFSNENTLSRIQGFPLALWVSFVVWFLHLKYGCPSHLKGDFKEPALSFMTGRCHVESEKPASNIMWKYVCILLYLRFFSNRWRVLRAVGLHFGTQEGCFSGYVLLRITLWRVYSTYESRRMEKFQDGCCRREHNYEIDHFKNKLLKQKLTAPKIRFLFCRWEFPILLLNVHSKEWNHFLRIIV